MKIKITLEVSDAVRRYLGSQVPPERRTRKGVAVKSAAAGFLTAYIQGRLDTLSTGWHILPPPKLTDVARREHHQAVSYLRALGKSDEQICAWILAQQARADFPAPPVKEVKPYEFG